MKLIIFLILIACLQVNAKGYSQQKVTLNEKDAPLEKVFKEIRKQTGYDFIYNTQMLKNAQQVTVQVKDADLTTVLDACFAKQPFTYTIIEKTIVVKEKKAEVIEEQNLLPPTIDVHGRVVNEKGEPVEGVSVIIKGTNKGVATDKNGEFSIKGVDANATLVFTSVNMETFEIAVNGKTDLAISLKTKVAALGDVQVVANTGYQLVKPNEVTGSVTVVDNATINEQVGSNILNRLDGVAAGVLFPKQQLAGNPTFMIRGLSTINGLQAPLIIVDNFPYEGDINNINPNDIESFTILKDAAAASIWGARAGNGVLVITTKKGRLNQPLRVSVNADYIVTGKPDLHSLREISSSDYIDVEKMLFQNGYYDDYLSDNYYYPAVSPVVEILNKERNGLISDQDANAQINAYKNVDAADQYDKYVYRKANTQQYNVNLSGGSGNIGYYLSAGYDGNSDQLDNKFNRYTFLSTTSYRPTKNLDVSVKLQYSEIKTESGNSNSFGSVRTGNWSLPYLQLTDENGNALPVATTYRQTYLDTAGGGKLLDWNYYPLDDYKHVNTKSDQQDLIADLGLHYQLMQGLSFDAKYMIERQTLNAKTVFDQQSYNARNLINLFSQIDWNSGTVKYVVPLGGILNLSNSQLTNQNLRGQINYVHSWANNNITAFAGGELRETRQTGNGNTLYGYNDNTLTTTGVDFANYYPTYINGDYAYIPNGVSLTDLVNRFASVYTNAAYTYNEKYTASLSARRDASNLFGVNANDKWKPLWSAGLAWNIYKESFYKYSWLPYLKLRATYGFSGNVNPNAVAVTTLYYQNPQPPSNLPYTRVNSFPNPELKWEKSRQINVGLDFELKDQIVTGTIETYYKRGIDLYGPSPVDPTNGLLGQSTIEKNVANMAGKGVDVTLNTKNVDKKFKWFTTFLFSYNSSKATNYYIDSNEKSGSFLNNGFSINPYPGRPLYGLIAFKWGGLDASGNPQGLIGKDVSTDYFTITQNTNVQDLIFKPSLPLFFGSFINTFSYKGFKLTANIVYRLGYYFIRPSLAYSTLFNNGAFAGSSDYANRWQKEGDENKTNVPSMIYPADENRDIFYNYAQINLIKADNIKLQYINLSYDFSKSTNRKIPFQNLQLYINLSNLGILWRANKYGIDPDYITSPTPSKTYAIGIKATF